MSTLLIHNAEIITGDARPIKGGWILVDGEYITAIGKKEPLPAADIVVDAGGDLIMPGMIDT
ncbi:MAG: dihydroorotase, partial [Muribaculaceae bacterium]|nr:dihydroorotase [Muribaculaceae bacterium]